MQKVTTARALAGLAAIGVLAGCGTAAASTPVTDDDTSRGQALFAELTGQIYGSRTDRLTAEALLAHRVHAPIVACMAAKGATYIAPGPENQYEAEPAPGDLTSYAPLGDLGIAQQRANVAHAHDARQATEPTHADPAAQARYAAQVRACTDGQPDPGNGYPQAQSALAVALADTLQQVESRPDIKAKLTAYGDCLHKAGFRAGTWSDLYQQVFDQFPDSDAPWAKVRTDAAWPKAVAAEQAANKADTQCRTDLRNYALGAAAASLTAFGQDHRDELAKVTAQWQNFRRAAKAAGVKVSHLADPLAPASKQVFIDPETGKIIDK